MPQDEKTLDVRTLNDDIGLDLSTLGSLEAKVFTVDAMKRRLNGTPNRAYMPAAQVSLLALDAFLESPECRSSGIAVHESEPGAELESGRISIKYQEDGRGIEATRFGEGYVIVPRIVLALDTALAVQLSTSRSHYSLRADDQRGHRTQNVVRALAPGAGRIGWLSCMTRDSFETAMDHDTRRNTPLVPRYLEAEGSYMLVFRQESHELGREARSRGMVMRT